MGIIIMFQYMYTCFQKVMGIYKGKVICLPNKEYKVIIDVKEQIWLTNVKYL